MFKHIALVLEVVSQICDCFQGGSSSRKGQHVSRSRSVLLLTALGGLALFVFKNWVWWKITTEFYCKQMVGVIYETIEILSSNNRCNSGMIFSIESVRIILSNGIRYSLFSTKWAGKQHIWRSSWWNIPVFYSDLVSHLNVNRTAIINFYFNYSKLEKTLQTSGSQFSYVVWESFKFKPSNFANLFSKMFGRKVSFLNIVVLYPIISNCPIVSQSLAVCKFCRRLGTYILKH